MAGRSVAAISMGELVKLLHEGEYTKLELQTKLGLTSNTVKLYLDILHRRHLVHIAGWRRGPRGNPAALWTFGYEMSDATKPKPLPQSVYSRRYRANKRGVLNIVVQNLC